MKPFFSSFLIEDVDLREACVTVQTWKSSSAHFRLMYQEKLIQGSRLRRPPEANDIAGSMLLFLVEKNIRKIEKAILFSWSKRTQEPECARFPLFECRVAVPGVGDKNNLLRATVVAETVVPLTETFRV